MEVQNGLLKDESCHISQDRDQKEKKFIGQVIVSLVVTSFRVVFLKQQVFASLLILPMFALTESKTIWSICCTICLVQTMLPVFPLLLMRYSEQKIMTSPACTFIKPQFYSLKCVRTETTVYRRRVKACCDCLVCSDALKQLTVPLN